MPGNISLCVIAGAEQAIIMRLLESFAPAFDELSLVLALGATPADDTAALAERWCKAHGKGCIVSAYRNAPEAAAWPHVDNFAAARNQAFGQATGAWLVWADCDDIVTPETPAGALRACIAEQGDLGSPGSNDVLHFPYDVPGTNKRILRERVIRRSIWEAGRRWVFPVHENFRLQPGDLSRAYPAPVWRHTPAASKPMSIDRNLRILGGSLAEVPTQLFYAHQEHFLAGRKKLARTFGEQALAFPALPASFRYEILLNFAKGASTSAEGLEYSGRAYAVLPNCREALALMAAQAFSSDDPERALVATETMLTLPEPEQSRRPWTHEAKWYGWAGWDLRARALRFAKRHPSEVEAAQAKAHGERKPVISLLHATRGRPQQAFNTRELWFCTAMKPQCVEHIFAVDEDDAVTRKELVAQFDHVVVGPSGSCVRAWNAAARIARGDILIQLSDDWVPTYGWDQLIVDAISAAKRDYRRDPVVVAVDDGNRRDALLCMAICTRARWEQQGRELFSADYESMYSDNEFSFRAWHDGVVVDARGSITFQHLHPAFGKGKMDATYAATNAAERYIAGWETFVRRNPEAPLPPMPQGASLERAQGIGNPYAV